MGYTEDLQKYKEMVQVEKDNMYSYMQALSICDADKLKVFGFTSVETAIYKSFLFSQSRIQQLTKDFVKRYPDE